MERVAESLELEADRRARTTLTAELETEAAMAYSEAHYWATLAAAGGVNADLYRTKGLDLAARAKWLDRAAATVRPRELAKGTVDREPSSRAA